MTGEKKREFTLRITQASPIGMIEILYEMMLAYMDDAEKAFHQEDKNAFTDAIHKAQKCLKELQNSLCMQYDPAPALFSLYILMHQKLTKAITWFSVEPLQAVMSQVSRLRDAYAELDEKSQEKPVMIHAQSVYAGLTYGRNSLVENIDDEGADRGFRV